MKRLRHPIRAIREPFGTAGLIIAVVALIAAVGGTAWAASGLNGKQKKEVEKIAKKYAGKPGAPGATGPAGATGKEGAKGPAGANGTNGTNGTSGTNGTNGTSVTNTAVPTTSATCNHLGGAEFKVGSGTATTACNGQSGFTETLPAGKTETGYWSAGGQGFFFSVPVSFPIPLAATGPIVYLNEEESLEAATNSQNFGGCAGEPEAPTAPAGTLCIYTIHEEEEGSAINQISTGGGPAPDETFTKAGARILFEMKSATSEVNSFGTFAVTAPTAP